MLRILLYVLGLAALVAGSVWLADRPGSVSIDWLGWRIETSVPVLLAALAIAVAILTGLMHLVGTLVRLPGRWTAERREARRRKGYLALTDGLVAAAGGEAAKARKLAGRAEKLLIDPALTGFLSAQAAQLSGDSDAARAHYQAMLERPETAALGLRGLLDQALARDDGQTALEMAIRARVINPGDPWLAETAFTLLVKAGRLAEAQDLLADATRRKAIVGAQASRRRALVLNERAARAEADGDSRHALDFAKQAMAADPSLTDAALRLVERLRASGRIRRAAGVAEKAWTSQPAPALVGAYVALRPDEDPMRKIRRIEKLVAGKPDHPDSHLALAEASMDTKLWGQARKHLLAAVQLRPSAHPYRLLARLEQLEYDDQAAAKAWLDKAAQAPADPAWVCRDCTKPSLQWSLSCPHCGTIDSLTWASPRPTGGELAPRVPEGVN